MYNTLKSEFVQCNQKFNQMQSNAKVKMQSKFIFDAEFYLSFINNLSVLLVKSNSEFYTDRRIRGVCYFRNYSKCFKCNRIWP